MRYLLTLVISALLSMPGHADMESTRKFDRYEVHYMVFDSEFVTADIAALHGLVRGPDQALINISVHEADSGEAVRAAVTGQARNLIQQSKPLRFKTIEEPDAIYAIASLRHSNEEVFHFSLEILPEGETRPLQLEFTRKLYRN